MSIRKQTIIKYQDKVYPDNLEDWLRREYITNLKSIRDLMELLSTKSNRTVTKLLNYYNIPIRHGSVAIATQWADNPKRRKEQAMAMKGIATGNTTRRLPDEHFSDKLEEYNLTLIERTIVDGLTMVKYACNDCGYIGSRSAKTLNRGCGSPECLGTSNGELWIASILKECGVDYETQVSYNDCRYINPLRFDFRVVTEKGVTLIEYQGIQHYEPVEFFGGAEEYQNVVCRDEIKRDYCKKQGIHLLEIPYTYDTKAKVLDFLKRNGIV